MKRKAERSEGSESEGEGGIDDSQARLLAMLDAQCAAALGKSVEIPAASTSRLDDDDDEEDSDEDSDVSDELEEGDSEEWTGLGGIDDDDENQEGKAAAPPPVIAFNESALYGRESANGKRARYEDAQIPGERDDFMSTKVRRRDVDTTDAANRSKAKGKGRLTAEEESEEKHLKELDASLYSLISGLPASSTSVLPSLSAALPSPRLLTRKAQENEAIIDKRAPRTLREKIYAARLERAKIADAEAKAAGVVTPAGKGKYALTKKERRERTGVEDERRKKAKGITGVVGKMKKGGAVLRLNRNEITRGNEGDFSNIAKRRHKGAPKGHHGKR